jgi:hypothetical protein
MKLQLGSDFLALVSMNVETLEVPVANSASPLSFRKADQKPKVP